MAQYRPEGTSPPCIYHRRGHCVRGDSCAFSHAAEKSAVSLSTSNPRGSPVTGTTLKRIEKSSSLTKFALVPSLSISEAKGATQSGYALRPNASAFTPTSVTASPRAPNPFGLCKFYAQGRCTKGAQCPFPHGNPRSTSAFRMESKSPADPMPTSDRFDVLKPPEHACSACKFFLQGRCTKGDTCAFWHPVNQKALSESKMGATVEPRTMGSIRTDVDFKLKVSEVKVHARPVVDDHEETGARALASHGSDPTSLKDTVADDALGSVEQEQQTTRTKLKSTVTYGPGACIQSIVTAFESSCVILHNIPPAITHGRLIALAEPFGPLESVFILPARDSLARPTARILFTNTTDAGRAVAKIARASELQGATARLDLRAAESGAAVLRSTKAKLTWFAPSLVAWAHYSSLSNAREQATRLNGQTFNGNVIRASFQTPTRNQTRSFSVELSGLPLDASSVHLKRFCHAPSITMGRPSFVVENALKELRALLSRSGPLEAFDLPDPSSSSIQKKTKLVAFIQFADPDAATRAVATLNGSRQTFLRGSQIFLELIHSVKYMLPAQQFSAIRRELDALRDMLQTCKLRYHDKNERGEDAERVCVRAYGPDAKALGVLKTELEQLLKGDAVLDETSQLAWHEYFATAQGAQFLDSVFAQTQAYVKCDTRVRTFHVFGSHAGRTAAKARILAMLAKLKAQEHILELDARVFRSILHGKFEEVKTFFGEKVSLDVVHKRLIVHGDEADVRAVRDAIARTQLGQAAQSIELADGSSCPVCFCDVTDPVVLTCTHAYCRACLQHYLGSLSHSTAGSQSIRATCLADTVDSDGTHTPCGHNIALTTIRSLLSPGEEERLLEAAFRSHIHSRSQEFRYCPTADCQTIYRVSTDGTLLRCPSCLVRMCSTCHVESHEGLTCAEFKDNASGGEDSFRRWREEHGVKACPGCGAGLEKSGGCNHMTCAHCGAHMCWVCMKTFRDVDSGRGVYAHMRAEHGGIGI